MRVKKITKLNAIKSGRFGADIQVARRILASCIRNIRQSTRNKVGQK